MYDKETLDTVGQIFTSYLETNAYRKTNERFIVLHEIYLEDGHFDIESLFTHIKNKGHSISRATLYNTIELLLACGLVVKHQFGRNVAQFERAYKFKQHDHVICIKCGIMMEFCDPRIQEIKTSVSNQMNFDISHHSLTFYGKCRKHNKT